MMLMKYLMNDFQEQLKGLGSVVDIEALRSILT